MEFIVDIQTFRWIQNELIIKELAIHHLGSREEPVVYLFKPPCEWNELPAKYKAQNLWVMRNHLHIHWDTGDLPYTDLERVLRIHLHKATMIYVKGEEKEKWLKRIFHNVTNIEKTQKTESFKVMRSWRNSTTVCLRHEKQSRSRTSCAASNVLLIEKLISIHKPSQERSLEIFHNVQNLQLMESEDIKQLPLDFIITHAAESVDAAWDKIPEEYRENMKLKKCLKCRVHDHSDKRIIPIIKNCIDCNSLDI